MQIIIGRHLKEVILMDHLCFQVSRIKRHTFSRKEILLDMILVYLGLMMSFLLNWTNTQKVYPGSRTEK
jgi:hypothetical protein